MQFFVDATQISCLSLTMAYAHDSQKPNQTARPVFTASALASFLEEDSLSETFNAPLISFTNFLNYLCDPTEPITPALVNRFYYRALTFNEWQKDFQTLSVSTTIAIRNFCDASGLEFSFADIVEPNQIQVVELTQPKVKDSIVDRFLKLELSGTDQFRMFEDRNRRSIAVIRLANGPLRVLAFPKWAALIDGEVVPLCTDFALSYNAKLEFETGTAQHLELNSHTHARFKFSTPNHTGVSEDHRTGLNGAIVRGPQFEPVKVLKDSSLIKEAELFYPIKHLEQFFVKRNSDAVYLELIENLNKAIDLVLTKDPDGVTFAQQVLERARFAHGQIFPDDKPLMVQVQSLERALQVENAWPQKTDLMTNLRIELD
jgi:hypothetical protein